MQDIINKVSIFYGIDIDTITSKSREGKLIEIRQFISKILKDEGYTLYEIGFALKRNHSTIINALSKFEDYSNNKAYIKKFNDLYSAIK